MNLAADIGRHSGRATPSLHGALYRHFEEATGRRSTYPLPIPVQTNRASSIVTVGLDLAKTVFQIHAIGFDGTVLARRKLRRREVIGFFTKLSPCLVGMEACASAHHWARELNALGREVRLIPPNPGASHRFVHLKLTNYKKVTLI